MVAEIRWVYSRRCCPIKGEQCIGKIESPGFKRLVIKKENSVWEIERRDLLSQA